MNDFNENNYYSDYSRQSSSSYSAYEAVDSSTMIATSYLYMVIALVVTAFSAYYVAASPKLMDYFFGSFSTIIVLIVAEFGLVFGCTASIKANNKVLAFALFLCYSVVNGITLSTIFYVYDVGSIQNICILAAVMFAATSVYGFVTEKDLTSLGSLLMMGLIGLIIAGVANTFIFRGTGLDTVTSIIGVLVFVGLTAYDTQRMKKGALEIPAENQGSMAVFFAMQMYLDLINLILYLLKLFAKER